MYQKTKLQHSETLVSLPLYCHLTSDIEHISFPQYRICSQAALMTQTYEFPKLRVWE
jgi:hypothetical protein